MDSAVTGGICEEFGRKCLDLIVLMKRQISALLKMSSVNYIQLICKSLLEVFDLAMLIHATIASSQNYYEVLYIGLF